MSNPLERRVEQLLTSSQEVLDQCALPNGALIAANTDLAVYPATAENYRFSWARDAAYQLLATQVLAPGLAEDRAIRYTRWLRHVPDFAAGNVYLKRYGTNGARDVRYGEHFQPDQAGALIGTLDSIVPDAHPDIDTAIIKLATGLSSRWNHMSFGATQDLWENRETSATDGDVFTYSAAAVRHGLATAVARLQHIDTKHWETTIDEIDQLFDTDPHNFYLRKLSPSPDALDPDNTIDASLAGLVYPFERHLADPKVAATINAIDITLYEKGQGVHRYPGDTYDGIVRQDSRESTAGAWPLLTFWQVIALNALGKHTQARDSYYDTIDRLDYEYRARTLPDNLIPEQLHPDSERQGKGVLPLAWSHAKFVLATEALTLCK